MNKVKNRIKHIAISVAMATLVGCSMSKPTKATGDYNATEVGRINKVVQGVLLSERMVNVYAQPKSKRAAASGSVLDSDTTRRQGYEYVIRLDSGPIVSIVQTEDLHLEPKQRILVIYGSSTRVVPDQGSDEY